MASEPYRLERGPRTISMRSICSTGMLCNAALPEVAEPTRTPSISTSTCLSLLPRMDTEVLLPRPPLLVTLTPARRCSSSGTLPACWRSISSRVMRLLEAMDTGEWPVRLAVITCWPSSKASP